jgi:ribonuclease HI
MIAVNCDGLCEPVNPGGTACYGWAAYRNEEKLGEGCGVVCSGPGATNNVAEYTAVIRALEWLLEQGLDNEDVEIRSDSQLCMFQLNGVYAVRSPRILPLYGKAVSLARKFRRVKFRWVPREQNEEADALSRRAYAAAAPPNPARLEKARELAPLVRPLGGGRYTVPSQSGRGEYLVDAAAGTCTCPYFTGKGVKCKHLLAVEVFCNGLGG